MNKIENMRLFVQVVATQGLASAGRTLGMSAATVTARIQALEQHYKIRLLNRSTRKISLTEAGQRFYQGCLRTLSELDNTEASLNQQNEQLSGSLRITAPADFGLQYISPLVQAFKQQHPEVIPYLNLSDAVVSMIEHSYDVAIRFGNLPDSNLIVRKLANNHRVLVASPEYLDKHGVPSVPKQLLAHQCLVMERLGEPLNEWKFKQNDHVEVIRVAGDLMSNRGDIIRQWALAGCGIAYKSIWDVKKDLERKALVTLLDEYTLGFQPNDEAQTDLQLVYPSRQYLPKQVDAFIDFLKTEWAE